ncbi:MAG: hypothetical protein R3E39_09590 [Anaerolineae bacterium]
MPPIQLQIYSNPGGVDVYVNLRRKDGNHERIVAFIDTGAELSLLPAHFMSFIEYRLADKHDVVIDQAGIAQQSFRAIQAYIKLFLEDVTGNVTSEFEVPVWFANSDEILIGFEGLLDHAILHIDMPQRTGWIDLPTR